MERFFFILLGFLIVVANVIGFLVFKKRKNLYNAAFIILLLAGVFGEIGSVLALFIIRDPFALFYGLNMVYYLLINSFIVFILAIFVTIIKKYNSSRII
ncbi:3-isopropylmalate dehydrogenase [Lysinibacillus sp. Y5S-8]|uniref:3-isopropylmalate dehydrogenase n=1 Tax=Lysinibacillus sp. Y5S-8 TaxID=3122488 RepID=UPI0030D1F6D9